jgi:hypothetical protein
MCFIKKAICRFLLPYVSRWENKLWREVYARPRKYCKCSDMIEKIKNNMPSKDMFK